MPRKTMNPQLNHEEMMRIRNLKSKLEYLKIYCHLLNIFHTYQFDSQLFNSLEIMSV